ncbi:MAG TPA: WG repeat-containing protein [Bacteroidales bacterium]|nr:WG repeat-containing protein [Bacteroidales bacterium]
MRDIASILTILSAGLMFSCKSQAGDELLLQGIMKNRISNLDNTKYTEKKNGDTVTFEVADKRYSLKGYFSQVADYKVVSLYETDNTLGKYLTAIFAHEGGFWQSVFENELENGKLDTIIDLNKDKVDEIILQPYEHMTEGYESKLGIYARKESQKYTQIGLIAPVNYRGPAFPKISSTAELLQVGDYTWLFVNTQESDKVNGEPVQKNTGIFYMVTTLGGLETLYADLLILNRDPLIFKYQQDNLWGIFRRDVDEIKSKPLNFMDGFKDMLTISRKTREILPSEYTEILLPSEGLIPVKNREDAWGFVNLKGELVVDCKFLGVSEFENGKAVVRDEEEWRKAYHYIDTTGNDLGLFFDKIYGNDCIEARLTISNESGERFSEQNLSNCPDGVISVHYQGWEWSSGEAYYPGARLEDVIARSADNYPDFSYMLKKFDGSSLEYTKDEYTFKVDVVQGGGSILNVSFSKSSDMGGGSIEFEVRDNGVMVSTSYGT